MKNRKTETKVNKRNNSRDGTYKIKRKIKLRDYIVKNEKLLCVILTIIITYFIVFINFIKDTNNILVKLDITFFQELLFVAIIFGICYITIYIVILKSYKWVLNLLLKKYMDNISQLFKPIFIGGLVINSFIIIFTFIINYYIFKTIKEQNYEIYNFFSLSAQNVLSNVARLINYLVILSIIGIILYQLWQLNKLKVPFVRSLFTIVISMIALTYLLHFLTYTFYSFRGGSIAPDLISILLSIFLGVLAIKYINAKVR